ncbi:unnamed protein product [Owenia fusiformis]|uniref:Uncharacterized protein n=1 Tax=Owenia fusiformis TaxID=6347 RepID=A0A8J1Y150_OWEFU|nr:unnamed protein product [Owenia fusiformis]
MENRSAMNITTLGGYQLTPESVTVPILFLIIFILGLIGNATLLYIVVRHQDMRNTPNWYLVNLAIGDLLLICTYVPFAATIYTVHSWPFGESICKLGNFMRVLSVSVSVLTLAWLSEERYATAVQSNTYKIINSTKMTIGKILSVWLIAVIFGILNAISANIQDYTTNDGVNVSFCLPFQDSWGEGYASAYTIVSFLILFALPLIVIALFYIRLAYFIATKYKRTLDIQELQGQYMDIGSSDEAEHKLKHDEHTTNENQRFAFVEEGTSPWLILCLVILFVMCWLPRHIYLLWFYLDPSPYNIYWHGFKIAGFCLMFLNSCVNPCALCLLDSRWRKYFKQHLCCIRG